MLIICFLCSYLTSPTIRLLPSPPCSQPCSDTQYIVHRALLTSKSQYLKKRTRESYILLENTTEETVGLFLEWLYRGDYEIPTNAIDEQEEETEVHPVVQAAMAGPVGVWGKKAAVLGRPYVHELARTPGRHSQYVIFGENGEVSVRGGKYWHHSEKSMEVKHTDISSAGGKPLPTSTIQLPSPPASPTVGHTKPNINGFLTLSSEQNPTTLSSELKPQKPTTTTKSEKLQPQPNQSKPIVTLGSILASYLALYVLSLRYQITSLAQLTIIKISGVLESYPPPAETLVDFIRGIYYDSEETGNCASLTKGTALRGFIAKYSSFRLEEVKSSDGFKKLIGEGGEFVVDLVGCVMGGADKGDIWVK